MRTIRKSFICVLVFLIVIILCIPNSSYAELYESYSPNTKIMGGTGIIENAGNTIVNAIQLIGSIASVIVLILIGIKYMVGSVEEKAEYKSEMIPYIIGAVLLFSVSNLLAILKDILSGGNQDIAGIGNRIIGALGTIGSFVSVIVIIVLGIKYMFGSLEERAEYKRTMIPYVIGAALVFAASTIAGIVYNMVI